MLNETSEIEVRCTWFNSDNHIWLQLNPAGYTTRIMDVHAQVMADMMWAEMTNKLDYKDKIKPVRPA